MAKALGIAALFVTLSCFCCLAYATTTTNIFVEGRVYCDPCRVQFETRISEPLEGAVVELECRNRENGTVSYTLKGKTGKDGIYSLPTDEDMQDLICEVRPVSSPKADCKQHFDFERARVLITYENGVSTANRYANPVGFMKDESCTECEQVLRELFPEETEDQ